MTASRTVHEEAHTIHEEKNEPRDRVVTRAREGARRAAGTDARCLPARRAVGAVAWVLAAAIGLSGCEGYEAEVVNRTPFDPPPVFAEWWQQTVDCSGLSGDFALIDWWLATSIVGDQRVAAGRWSPPHDIIIVRGYEDDPAIVRHEMLHDLLAGDQEHADPRWEACGL